MVTALHGTVLGREGSRYRVATDRGTVTAVLRGKAKQGGPRAVVGDRVVLDQDAGAGETFGIVQVEPRHSLLARRLTSGRGRGSRPVAANIDQVLVVAATTDPAPVPQLIDRLLVVAEANHLPASVVLNKIDLDRGGALAERFRSAGYPVILTSARTGEGVDTLRSLLRGKVVVLTGPSGAGKSSLLNAVQPGLRLRVGDISAKLRRGTGTTVAAVMIPLEGGGYLVDTPGFSDVGVWGVESRHLAACFPDFGPYLGHCRFADCRHLEEPDCTVREALAQGRIQAGRMESYRVLLRELEELPEAWE
jgi:ribosome biogenesis GTPase